MRSAVALALLLLASCGSPPPAQPPPAPATPTPTASAAPTASAVPPTAPQPARASMPIQPSKLVEDAKRIGIDFQRPLESLSTQKKKSVMGLFVRALGYEGCTGCHVEGDFDKETHNMRVARQMWDHFLVDLRDAQGGALFCDSCHGGKAKILDRSSMDAVQKLMETDYQGKLTRADKKAHDCSTCHGPGPEPRIIEKLWGIAAR
jgi:hypothetical protein